MTRTRSLSGVALVAAVALTVSSPALAANAKPAGDLVPGGLKVLTWHYPLVVGGGKETTGTKVITNRAVVGEVRSLINALPVTPSDPHRICPDYVLRPYSVVFSAAVGSPAVTTVVFELGGCPYAQVYQHGVKVSPTLGGAHLAATYARIQKLISPRGVPLG